ncbi:leucine-rich repeat flightless-interacting protein 2-like isoform X11 [Leucoraja erinacea]|uniref:leucine-rich repeat flightless-interacting protein 2-like isoform X11 n=1 Tax=Leucoraja erinaceus TaxID=7782 RepID=UPI0024580004|nr:leucine-rich repeat flightless-interacting protein 2-like isoform X11 [Leucoraja erinacea]
MGTQGSGRKRIANRERLSAEDDTLNLIAREAEARLAAKRAARAEAREIRMKELERQQKEIYQVQKKYYGLDTKWGDIEQWMEDSEKYSRRFRRHTSVSDEDDWTSVGSRGSARPSEYNCVLGSSSRTSSRASSARASPVVEEKLDKDFIEKGSRAASSLSAATLASLGGTSSRRGSGETTTSIDTEGSIREIKEIFELKDQIQDVEGKYMEGLKELKDSLMEVEEKYKKAMVSNAQLDNEKANLMYQVDTLREDLLGLEEQLAEMHRGHEEKSKELERQKHAYCILQHQFEEMKETLQEREEMLTEIKELNQKQRSFAQEITDLQETLEWKDKKIGALERQKEYSEAIRIDRDELRNEVMMLKERLKAHGLMTNGEAEHVGKEGSAHRETAQTRPQAEAQQQSSSDKPLDFRVNTFIDEKEALLEQIKKLKAQLDEKTKIGMTEKAANSDTILENGMEVQVIDVQSEFSFKGDANRQISDYKFKLTKTEQEITALEQNIIRLESQVLRYKTAAENAEKVEDELKAEKRKLQREVRSALDKIEELEMSNTHLSKRLEKMKANRSALLSQQ